MGTERLGPSGEVSDIARHRALAATSRVRMLDLVRRSADGMTATEVTAATGLHPSTVRAHLDQLTESGLLTRQRTSDGSPGRPAWRYRARPRPTEGEGSGGAADRPYRGLAAALIAHLARDEDDPFRAGVRAGRDWGRALAAPLGRVEPLDGLVRVLGDLGFAPRVADRQAQDAVVLRLRSCPFLELAEAAPDVVCGVHEGVIGGALGVLGAAGVDSALEPFAEPGACIVRIYGRAPRGSDAAASPEAAGADPAGADPAGADPAGAESMDRERPRWDAARRDAARRRAR